MKIFFSTALLAFPDPMRSSKAMKNNPYIVDRYEVERLTSLHKSSIYRLMKEDKFPKPLRLSTMRVAWRLADIEDWVNSLETTDRVLEA